MEENQKRLEIERFIDDNFEPKVEDKGDNVTIIYEGKSSGIENGVVWMETAKRDGELNLSVVKTNL